MVRRKYYVICYRDNSVLNFYEVYIFKYRILAIIKFYRWIILFPKNKVILLNGFTAYKNFRKSEHYNYPLNLNII